MSNRKLLLIAYHFPPIQGSTGTIRTIAFSKYLSRNGWDVSVLTIDPSAYEDIAAENERLIPPGVSIHRAWGFDCRRRLAVMGSYPLLLALPDRWQSWIAGGFIKGSRLIQAWNPDVIMSTYPIPSAHVLGYLLHKRFKLPWVAEFRDPMLQSDYPMQNLERRAFAKIENLVFSNASRVVVTTEGCMSMYLARFPQMSHKKISCISNGYDAEMFPERIVSQPNTSDSLVLLHSGLLYANERDPTAFFAAVRSLKENGFLSQFKVEFRFRATGDDENYRRMVEANDLASCISILPRIPYAEALNEMRSVDGLLLFQASNCNDQIPAKVYEYLYCQKPIFGLTDPAGETGRLLLGFGIDDIAILEDSLDIERKLTSFLQHIRAGTCFVPGREDVEKFSRKSLTSDLDRVLVSAIEDRDYDY